MFVSISLCFTTLATANTVLSFPHRALGPRTSNSTNDLVHSWGPSIFFDLVDRAAYPHTNFTTQELCQQIGSKLETLNENFWQDLGGTVRIIASATPLIAEAAVKYSRGE
ncbi:hypothetical protein GGX14DRAFT_424972 [Mycena pura]|uniref:Uncharacterized protein n=1 Tax=Mycena pura TaxID=153505 RepID=A0AAD7E204_9AGAR|nr:hypothetical protein GGX14DRAFT_424972 [Mycena pura]